MRQFIVALLLLTVTVSSVFAQVHTRRVNPAEFQTINRFTTKSLPPSVRMSKIDVDQLLTEDEADKELGLPFRFGKDIDVDLGLENSGQWEDTDNGRIWKIQITSEKAFSINLIFDYLWVAEGAELYIYNKGKTMLMGPIISKHNNDNRRFSTDLIEGETIFVELFEPVQSKGKSKLHIIKVIHGYKNTFLKSGDGQSANCNNDINCPEGANWQDESDAVAMVLLANGTRLCSGALINNTCQDFTPNFLTAFHCIDISANGILSQGEIDAAEDWVFRFQYKSPTCNGGDDSNFFSFNGATFRAAWQNSDFALLELNQLPDANTGIRLAGWNRGTNTANSIVGIHHPSGNPSS